MESGYRVTQDTTMLLHDLGREISLGRRINEASKCGGLKGDPVWKCAVLLEFHADLWRQRAWQAISRDAWLNYRLPGALHKPCAVNDGVHDVNDASERHEHKLATPRNTFLTHFSAKQL